MNATMRGVDDLHQEPKDWNLVVNMMERMSTIPHANEGFYKVISLKNQREVDEIIHKLSAFS